MSKIRLDRLVAQKLPGLSRNQIHDLILQGQVQVAGKIVTKPGQQFAADIELICQAELPKYVSRAGLKLAHALDYFKINVAGKIALDAGLSTGGFTDCLLQNGIAKVYGIDVGTQQVHPKILADARVLVFEQTNLRYLTNLPELVDLVTLDLSFISLLKVITNVAKLLKPNGELVVLIKPQFEVGPEHVGTGGIVKNEQVRTQVVAQVIAGITQTGFVFCGMTPSPICGGDGNLEYLAYFVARMDSTSSQPSLHSSYGGQAP